MKHKNALLDQSIYRTAHDYPGGARALAEKIGLRGGTFNNKVDPDMETHIININEARAMMRETDNHEILFELARELSYVCTLIPAYSGVSDMELLNAWADWEGERAETVQAIKHALEDQTISRKELDKIRKEMFDDFQKELALLARLESLIDE